MVVGGLSVLWNVEMGSTMGNSPRARARRQALVVKVPARSIPPGYYKIMQAYRELRNPALSSTDIGKRFYREEYDFAPSVSPADHGRSSTYTNWYCRCPLCTWANAQHTKEVRERAKKDSPAQDV